jgi:hypothetical protein
LVESWTAKSSLLKIVKKNKNGEYT